jgi:hypothetical protein
MRVLVLVVSMLPSLLCLGLAGWLVHDGSSYAWLLFLVGGAVTLDFPYHVLARMFNLDLQSWQNWWD